MEDGILLLFRLCTFLAEQVGLAVAQHRLTLFNRDRFEGKELVATPTVFPPFAVRFSCIR
jgi:hypothetical protein